MDWKITGDKHGNFKDIKNAARNNDGLIILGDSGINYNVYEKSENEYEDTLQSILLKKKTASECPDTTFFCIQGNHEARAELIDGYKECEFLGGKAVYQEEYPNIIFGLDGEIYTFNNKKYIVIGGAYSVDKEYRLKCQELGIPGRYWFKEEQPNKEIKEKVEEKLKNEDWYIHGILSHTCPLKFQPTHLFLSGLDQNKVDSSTEEWLGKIEKELHYDVWYFGHYHGDEINKKAIMLYNDVQQLK